MAKHESASYRFTVKEGNPSASGNDDAPLSLMLEPTNSELSFLRSGILSLHLSPGTTIEEAQALAKQLNRAIPSIGFTPSGS